MSSGGALPQSLSSSSSFITHQISNYPPPIFVQLAQQQYQHHHHHPHHYHHFQQLEQQSLNSNNSNSNNTYHNIINNTTTSPQHRIKLKRQRQRVDAGEPRNPYQAARAPMLQQQQQQQQQQRFANDFQINNVIKRNQNGDETMNTVITTIASATGVLENDNNVATLNSIFPWITTAANAATVKPRFSTAMEQVSDTEDSIKNLSQQSADNDNQHQQVLQSYGGTHSANEAEGSEFSTAMLTTSRSNDAEARTAAMGTTDEQSSFSLNIGAKFDDDNGDDDDDDTNSYVKDEHGANESISSPTPSASCTSAGFSGSSSRRKSAAPQRQFVDIEEGCNLQIEQNADRSSEEKIANNTAVEQQQHIDLKLNDEIPKNVLAASLAVNINPHNRIQEMIDMQKRIYSNWIDQQKKLLGINDEEQKRIQVQLIQQQIQRDYAKLAQSLKQELINGLNSSVDKIIAEFITAEATVSAQRTTAALVEQQREHAAATVANRNPFLFHPLYHPFNGQSGSFHNPFMQNSLPVPAPMPQAPSTHHSTGIFPAASAPRTTFNAFVPHLKAASPATSTLRKMEDFSPFMPRKKRSKVTDCSRLNKVQSVSNVSREVSSLPNSARSSPQLSSYFPPTMVGHPLYGSGAFGTDDHDSPVNSDDASDCSPYDGNLGGSSTLTPMHLRKAKLMFFYTRYPNSAVLKSYFPDIRFNKNNTAQLVKWFSNFREFFYNQMDKYARNYLAEGVKNKEDIVVTPESEIYKSLNQHYNRNNHIQPPERLSLVIQETLREFFCAVQSGRDAEPSWKKTIYKVINRMDDPIPEYFRDPNFLERLEG